MIEVGWVEELDGPGVCAAVLASRRAELEAEAARLRMAVHWADLHSPERLAARQVGEGSGRVLPGMERTRRSGSEGTPLVSEFAAVEFGALMGMGYYAADHYLHDAVDIYYRHPRLWAAILAGTAQVWQARQVVKRTAGVGLTLAQARWVDEEVAPYLGCLPWSQVLELVEAKIIAADPEAAEARRLAAEMERFVRTGRSSEHGLKTLYAKATAGEVIYLTAMIERIAAILAERGDTDPADVRRSKALGILG
ncbi:MAG TPA: hypothetical protein VFV65_07730, partial [Gemmatimonadales bacterium]|nr:hypothetical protein [Gemmatimonadales bacterium]